MMDNYMKSGYLYCCMGPHRLNKKFQIGSPHFHPYFKKYVGDDAVYNAQAYVCPMCHSKVMKLKKHEVLPTPGTRFYETGEKQHAITEALPARRNLEKMKEGSFLETGCTDHENNKSPVLSPTQCQVDPDNSISMMGDNDSQLSNAISDCLESQISVEESQSSEVSSISLQSITFDIGQIRACKSTESKCFVCGDKQGPCSRCKIPKAAIRDIWRTHHVLVPVNNRCCKMHRTDKAFTDETKTLILTLQTAERISEESLFEWLCEVTSPEGEPSPSKYDFEKGVTDDSYDLLVGMEKHHFDYLYSVVQPHMRNSENRTIRDALAMFLCLLHHRQSQEVIAYHFGTVQRVVSEAVDSVSTILEEHFVPQFLGFQYITDGDLMKKHSRDTVYKALSIPPGSNVMLCDGTYIFIEKPMDSKDQRDTFGGQKKRNFHRFMMGVLPSGHIAFTKGPFKATDNDAVVLNHLLDEEFLNFMGPGGHLILDRGFKQMESIATSKGLVVHSPEWLKKDEKQFSAVQANQSRLVTMCRWPVEATNGRLKQKFNFFMHNIPGGYSGKIERFFNIACALLNFISPIAVTDNDKHIQYAQDAADNVMQPNLLQQKLEAGRLIRSTVSWRRASSDVLEDFPKVYTLTEIQDICRGFYNVEQGKKYIKEHLDENGDFEIRLHKDHDSLVRAQIHSRFSNSSQHSCWVEYDSEKEGREAITGYYCTCRSGARWVTTCSHITAVVRYLMYERYQEVKRRSVKRAVFIKCKPLPRFGLVESEESQ